MSAFHAESDLSNHEQLTHFNRNIPRKKFVYRSDLSNFIAQNKTNRITLFSGLSIIVINAMNDLFMSIYCIGIKKNTCILA